VCVLSSGEVQDSLDIGLTEVPPVRKPTKDSPWKESAVLQHRQQLKTKMKYHKVEDPKAPHAKQVEDQKYNKTNKKWFIFPYRLSQWHCILDLVELQREVYICLKCIFSLSGILIYAF